MTHHKVPGSNVIKLPTVDREAVRDASTLRPGMNPAAYIAQLALPRFDEGAPGFGSPGHLDGEHRNARVVATDPVAHPVSGTRLARAPEPDVGAQATRPVGSEWSKKDQ